MIDQSFSAQFLRYLDDLKQVFKDSRTRMHVGEMGVACIAARGPKTVTSMIEFNSRHGNPELNHDNWSSSYRVFSTGKWEVENLSWKVLDDALEFVGEDEPVRLAVDDTLLNKTGRRIPECAYAKSPLSPPFQVNLVWGQRILCVSILVRSSGTSAYRSIPVFFLSTPSVKIPAKATDEQRKKLLELQKKSKMSVAGRGLVNAIRSHLDATGHERKKVIVCADGSFANRAFMEKPPHDTAMVCRSRSDLSLFRPLRKEERTGKKLYGEKLQTPEELARDACAGTERLECGVLHQHATISYKCMTNVRWKKVLKNQPCDVFAINGQYYRKYGRRQSTEPAYLVMTGDILSGNENGVPMERLLEAYLLRWEIEVGFRDQKNCLGIGKAQVWNRTSVKRTPAFMSSCYAMLLLASMKVFDDKRTEAFRPLPKWRNIAPMRPSIRDMVDLLRKEISEGRRSAA